MKAKIHPSYNQNVKVACACGSTWTTGSTLPAITVEICSACHPFYTGKSKLVDTAGRVDRFRTQLERSKKLSSVQRERSKAKQERAARRKALEAAAAKKPEDILSQDE